MNPSSRRILGAAVASDDAKLGLDTMRMRVASRGHRKMSAMNSAMADEAR